MGSSSLSQVKAAWKHNEMFDILDRELDVVSHGNSDPFLEADECMELEDLIEKMAVEDFLTGESDLPMHAEMDNDN